MFVKQILLLLSVAVILSDATAAPCTNVDQKISDTRKAELAELMAVQLQTDQTTVLGYLGLKSWSIVYVNPHNADEAFLFFNGSPSKTHYITLWAGAAKIDEENAIDRWVLENAPGIPKQLAACFAWSVTGGNRLGGE